MNPPRAVLPELLDALPAGHPDALRSRRDLRRVHSAMGTRRTLLAALHGLHPLRQDGDPLRLLELGAGDGTLMLGVARALGAQWAPVELTLLDRLSLVQPSTIDAFALLGWSARPQVCDALDWARDVEARTQVAAPRRRCDLVLATLFLHHFEPVALVRLLHAAAAAADAFVACEPHRGRVALAGSRLVALLGAGRVTREDAVTSVRAGFRDLELSDAWRTAPGSWMLDEYRAGPFNHCFRARSTGDRGLHDVP